MKRLLIIGTGGQSKVVLDCALETKAYSNIAFMTNDTCSKDIMGLSIFYEDVTTIEDISNKFDEVIVAIGNNSTRLKKSRYYAENGIKLATLIHPSAVVSRFSTIGEGTVALANAVVNPYAVVGRACIINTGAIVEHDCILGDGVHMSPKSVIGGTVTVGQESWLCIGSTVTNDVNIGDRVIVGAGAVVLNDVSNDVLVAGIPAKIRRHYM